MKKALIFILAFIAIGAKADWNKENAEAAESNLVSITSIVLPTNSLTNDDWAITCYKPNGDIMTIPGTSIYIENLKVGKVHLGDNTYYFNLKGRDIRVPYETCIVNEPE